MMRGWILSLVILGMLTQADARVSIRGKALPWLPAFEDFEVVEGVLEYSGPEDPAMQARHAKQFWWWARRYGREVYGGEKAFQGWTFEMHAGTWDKASRTLKITFTDVEGEALTCVGSLEVTPRAHQMLTALGCLWSMS